MADIEKTDPLIEDTEPSDALDNEQLDDVSGGQAKAQFREAEFMRKP